MALENGLLIETDHFMCNRSVPSMYFIKRHRFGPLGIRDIFSGGERYKDIESPQHREGLWDSRTGWFRIWRFGNRCPQYLSHRERPHTLTHNILCSPKHSGQFLRVGEASTGNVSGDQLPLRRVDYFGGPLQAFDLNLFHSNTVER